MSAPVSSAPKRRTIVKVGSSLLVDGHGAVREQWLSTLVADIAGRISAGEQIAVVSSGAIALGARRLKLPRGGRATLEDAQASAAVGQIALSVCWSTLFEAHGHTAAQMLLTLDDLEDRRRYLNAAATIDRLLALGVVPIINENDSVATQEIRFGDNDRLAARVASAAGAARVILLSDVDGLYTADPGVDPRARRIERVDRIDTAVAAMAGTTTSSGMGSGGMASKIEAARIATRSGADLVIISGKEAHPLDRLDRGEGGTVFAAPERTRSRKAWLAGRMAIKGHVVVDPGAVTAIASGSSLLPAGARDVAGKFARGDVVDIVDHEDQVVARGLSEYSSDEVKRILGMKSDAVTDVLGYQHSALVHRDHMVLL